MTGIVMHGSSFLSLKCPVLIEDFKCHKRYWILIKVKLDCFERYS